MTMTDRDYDIFRALADGEERHGYAIMQAVEEHTNGRLILGPGTLFRAIKHLLGDGLIVQTDRRPGPALEDARRRYYRITPRGRALLAHPGTPLAPLAPPDPGPAYRQYDVLRADPAGTGRVGSGAVYRTLDGLVADGLVVETGARVDPAVNPAVPRS